MPLVEVSREDCSVSTNGDPLSSCTPLAKAAKPVWTKQLTRLPYLVVYVEFKFVYTNKSKMGRRLLLASTSSHVQL